MNQEVITNDLRTVLRRLKLGPLAATLGERITLAHKQKMSHQDFLLLLLGDEVSRRDGAAASLRAQRGHLNPSMQLHAWDETAKVTFDRAILNELVSMRFIEQHRHVAIVGPVGVGKTFIAHALGHIACQHGHAVAFMRADRMLKTLKHARLDNSHEAELRKLLLPELLIIDDFGLDSMDAHESRDAYEILTERHRAGSIIITSNRGADEWLATFADPVRAQGAIDRFDSNSYDLIIDGESYRGRLKPTIDKTARAGQRTKE